MSTRKAYVSLEMHLRKASPGDSPILARAFLSMMDEAGLGRPEAYEAAAERLAASLAAGIADEAQGWYVCEDGGRIVATAGALMQPTPLDGVLSGKRGIIVGVYTHPDYRKRGAARLVVSAAVDWCRETGIAIVRLQTTEAARPLYESLGFTTGDVMTLKF